jgi:hypothetical protein
MAVVAGSLWVGELVTRGGRLVSSEARGTGRAVVRGAVLTLRRSKSSRRRHL